MNKNIKRNKAFVILFAVTLAAILLSIALGVINISLKETKFGTSAKDANDAFFAADTGAECVLFYDKLSGNSFPLAGPAVTISCASKNITPKFSKTVDSNGNTVTSIYNFVITGLGSSGLGCSNVQVFEDNTGSALLTTITSKGYNIGNVACDSSNSNHVERELVISDYLQ